MPRPVDAVVGHAPLQRDSSRTLIPRIFIRKQMEFVSNAREARGEIFSILHLNHEAFKVKLLITRAKRAEKTLAFCT